MTSPDRAALERFSARIRQQAAALPPPDPANVQRTALLLALIRLEQARDARQAQP